ncbi:hypothetical protein SprV_0200662900 [Sparganum proliferum]
MKRSPGVNGRRSDPKTTILRKSHHECSPTGKTRRTLQGHFKELTETAADQLRALRGPRPEDTGMAESSEDWHRHTKSTPDRRHQSQGGCSQVSGASDSQHRHSIPPNVPTLSTNIPRANRPHRSSSDPMHLPSDDCSCFFHDRPYFNIHFYHDGAQPHQRCSESRATLSLTTATTPNFATTAAATTNTTPSTTPATDQSAPNAPATTNTFTITTPTSNDVGSVPACPHRDRTFISHTALAGHL